MPTNLPQSRARRAATTPIPLQNEIQKNQKVRKIDDFSNFLIFLNFVLERDRGGSGTSRARLGEIRGHGVLLDPKP